LDWKSVYLELVSDEHLLWSNDWDLDKRLKIHHGLFSIGEKIGDVSDLAKLNLADHVVEVFAHVKDVGDPVNPTWNSAISILAILCKSINNFLIEVHGVSDLTIVILDGDSGQESQEVEDLLDDNHEKSRVDGLDGSKLIVVNITKDLFKFVEVSHKLLLHAVFILRANTAHVVEDGHHVINVGGINGVLFHLSFFKSFLKLLLPLDAKFLKLSLLLLLLDVLSLLEDVANFLIGNHSVILESHTVGTIEIPITVKSHKFTEFAWVLHVWVNSVWVSFIYFSLCWSINPGS
jgi:hypothetical protein